MYNRRHSAPKTFRENRLAGKGFGARLRALRQKKNERQSDLAAAVGVHLIQVGRIERNAVNPSVSVLIKLAEHFQVSLDFLVYGNKRESTLAGFDDPELLLLFREAAKLAPLERITFKKLAGDFLLGKKSEAMD